MTYYVNKTDYLLGFSPKNLSLIHLISSFLILFINSLVLYTI